jgi:hypothetical protein
MRKLGQFLCGQTDDGGVGVTSLLGGIILHVFLTRLLLAPRCEFVSDVLSLLMYSFVKV